jgi:hypothetical protein
MRSIDTPSRMYGSTWAGQPGARQALDNGAARLLPDEAASSGGWGGRSGGALQGRARHWGFKGESRASGQGSPGTVSRRAAGRPWKAHSLRKRERKRGTHTRSGPVLTVLTGVPRVKGAQPCSMCRVSATLARTCHNGQHCGEHAQQRQRAASAHAVASARDEQPNTQASPFVRRMRAMRHNLSSRAPGRHLRAEDPLPTPTAGRPARVASKLTATCLGRWPARRLQWRLQLGTCPL